MNIAASPVTVFWRLGYPYCMRLRARLQRARIQVDEVNIWEDPAEAAFVRSVAGSKETAPTVRIGDHAPVNPSLGRLIEEIRELDPSLIGIADGFGAYGEGTIATAQGDPIGALTLLVVDVRQAAQLLQCSRSLLYELIRAGELPTVKIGRLTRITVSALHGFVERGGFSHDPLVRGSPRGLLDERVDALWRLSDGRPRMRCAAVGVAGVARSDPAGFELPLTE